MGEPIPATIGKYEVISVLGRGAMGIVYRARDPLMDREVAIKTMLPEHTLDEESRERFFREARAAGKLRHWNIVTVYELGFDGKSAYIAMELLDGSDLRETLETDPDLALARRFDIVIEILEGIDFAHQHGVIHRDLKPANIHIGLDGHVRIMDFGIARLVSSEITRTGTVLGTVSYMSPEQVSGRRVDGRSDIFSIGVMLYELVTGAKPFPGDTITSIIYRIASQEPEPLPETGLPQGLSEVVLGALAKDPERRYQTGRAMADALRAVRVGVTEAPAPAPRSGEVAPTLPVTRRAPGSSPASEPEVAPTTRGAVPRHASVSEAKSGVSAMALILVAVAGMFVLAVAGAGTLLVLAFWPTEPTVDPSRPPATRAMPVPTKGSTDPARMYEEALDHINGRDMPVDVDEGNRLLAEAAALGHPSSMRLLGWQYQNGNGVPKSLERAVEWYGKAAELGELDAMNDLGVMYQQGWGIGQDYGLCLRWYRAAADRGHVLGMRNLAQMLEAGTGTAADAEKAAYWYRRAGDQGDAPSQRALGWMYQQGSGVSQSNEEALAWYRKAADQGHADAENDVGVLLQNGWGAPKDEEEAVRWYTRAASQDHALAMRNLGNAYRDGQGVSKDLATAAVWYQKAAELGDLPAARALAYAYQGGDGVRKDLGAAVTWYRKAADGGYAEAMNDMGVMYLNGWGVGEDRQQAASWFRKASEQGHVLATYNLGQCYEFGWGVTPGRDEAAEHYRVAAREGHKDAQKKLEAWHLNW